MDTPKLNISPKIIKSIMTLYDDPNRVFFEYLMNSIDQANLFFDKQSNSYSKLIDIRISIWGSTYKDTIIRFEDNTTGIDDISKITSSIGNSEKAESKFLIGQFAVGIYSFLAICNNMKISTKVMDSYEINSIEIRSDIFERKRTEEIEIGMILRTGSRTNNCWTSIALSEFIKDRFKEISIERLKSDIETHFEPILRRGNIVISIKNNDEDPVKCKPFNYSAYNGPVYEKEITRLEYTQGKKYSVLGELLIQKSPVRIFLKITTDKALDRKPFFVINGVRIADIADIRAFRTCSKGLIWSHPNVTGFIDVTGTLEPTIARDEFKNTKYSKALYQTLLKFEEEIKQFVEQNVNQIMISQFHKLESILNQAVNDLAKEINKKERSSLREGRGKIKATDMRNGEDVMKSFPLTSRQLSEANSQITNAVRRVQFHRRRQNAIDEAPKAEASISTIDLPVRINPTRRKDTSEYADSFGFNILIDSENEPMKDKNDKYLRSALFESNIVIYKKHSEFMKRLDDSIHGIPKISSSLVSYLCSEILLHYKSQKVTEDNRGDNKALLNDFLGSLYYLEDKLSWLKNKRISDFN